MAAVQVAEEDVMRVAGEEQRRRLQVAADEVADIAVSGVPQTALIVSIPFRPPRRVPEMRFCGHGWPRTVTSLRRPADVSGCRVQG